MIKTAGVARLATLMLACLAAGCTNVVAVSRPLPLGFAGIAMATADTVIPKPVVDLGQPGGGMVEIALRLPFRTKAQQQRLSGDITFYEVELIVDQGSAGGTNYADATLTAATAIKGSVFLDGPAAGQPAGTLADNTTAGRFAFTNVPIGTYRVRVKAKADASTPGTTVINNPDTNFLTNSGWEISDNTATVSNGTSIVSYTAPDTAKLVANVTLQSGVGETVSVGLNPIPGAAIPNITSTNF
jgi:hypothetical protein